ncbi:uncharacterized protein LOC143343523 [Colletes latitarsis]|uniref:uncharacterized protein LOC143343523 n=1 Tax=Colletes latitarsis TaxID=2605962 RepID=UPI0040370F20
MFKDSKGKSTTKIVGDRRKKSMASNNLYASPSVVEKFRKSAARKQKSHFSRSTLNATENDTGSYKLPRGFGLASNVPKDAAVHFGNFYGVQKDSKPQTGKTKNSFDSAFSSLRTAPRLEFTRQMVHKLERTAGTAEYARQVSALLEETVEPPHFKLHSVPAENSIPDGRQNPSGYPLWYKEPFKTPYASDEIYKLLKEYDNASGNEKDIFGEESSGKESCEEFSDDEEIKADDRDSKENDDISNESVKTTSPVQ